MGAILDETSDILRHFPEVRHPGTVLELFAPGALVLWYVVRIFLARD